MSQQAAQAVQPHWIADLVVGLAGALSVAAVAQAALPLPSRLLTASVSHAPAAHGVQRASTAPADAPDFIYGEPVAGYDVVSPFGLRKLPWEAAGRLHAGVDIAAPFGYPVQAAADGVVSRAGFDGGYGRFVEIRHAHGLKTLYAHLGGIEDGLKPGMAVRMGERIGRVGSSGSSTGAHLHFEVRDRKKRPLNPALFIDHAYATARDLPLKAAAVIPPGVRIAVVSYTPKKKRELMEARAAAAKAADGAQVVSLDRKDPVPGAQVVKLTAAEDDATRIANWKSESWALKDRTANWSTPDPSASWDVSGAADWGG